MLIHNINDVFRFFCVLSSFNVALMLQNFLSIFMQKNVYGASVIIFEGIMSFADKELLEVRLFVLFEVFFSHIKQLK